jgi:hypothetical protein
VVHASALAYPLAHLQRAAARPVNVRLSQYYPEFILQRIYFKRYFTLLAAPESAIIPVPLESLTK